MRAGDNGVAKLVLGKLKSIPLSPLLKRLRKEKKSVRTSEVCLFIDLYNLFIYNRAYSCFDSFFVLVLLFSFLSSFPLLPSLSCLFLLLFFFPLRLRHDIHSLPTQWKEGRVGPVRVVGSFTVYMYVYGGSRYHQQRMACLGGRRTLGVDGLMES